MSNVSAAAISFNLNKEQKRYDKSDFETLIEINRLTIFIERTFVDLDLH